MPCPEHRAERIQGEVRERDRHTTWTLVSERRTNKRFPRVTSRLYFLFFSCLVNKARWNVPISTSPAMFASASNKAWLFNAAPVSQAGTCPPSSFTIGLFVLENDVHVGKELLCRLWESLINSTQSYILPPRWHCWAKQWWSPETYNQRLQWCFRWSYWCAARRLCSVTTMTKTFMITSDDLIL